MVRALTMSKHGSRMAVVAAALIALCLPTSAHEGHKESGGRTERPAPVEKRAALTQAESAAFQKTVQRFVRNESVANGGVFILHDEKLDKDWDLRLIRLRTDSIGQLSDKLFTVCAEFKEANGKSKLDVDFLVNRTNAGWVVRQPLIHMVNGETRRSR